MFRQRLYAQEGWRRVMAVGLLVFMAGSLPSAWAQEGAETGPISLEQIEAAWKRQRERAKAIRARWSEQVKLAPQWLRDRHSAAAETPDGLHLSHVPPEGGEYGIEIEFLFLEGRWKQVQRLDEPEPVEFIRTVDASAYRTFQRSTGESPLVGTISSRPGDGNTPGLRILRYLQSPSTAKLELTEERQTIGGRECVALKQLVSRNDIKKVWIDPGGDFRIVRETREDNQGFPTLHFDITYREGESDSWVPAGWTMLRKKSWGPTFWSITATVHEWDWEAATADPEMAFAFPPGTRVTHRQEGEQYIQRKYGRQIIEKADQDLGYAELLARDEGRRLDDRLGLLPRHYFQLGGLWLGLLVAGGVLFRRSRRSRAAAASAEASLSG